MKIEIPNSLSATLKGAVTRGIKAVELDSSGHLIFTLTDNSTSDLGIMPIITSQTVNYQSGASGTEPPTGEWTADIPTIAQGQYLWTRTVFSYMDGSTVTQYSVSRMGLDGSGSVISVNDKSPDSNGNVSLNASDVGAANSTHNHETTEVSGLTDALTGKAAAVHSHEISDVSGLSNALSGKAAASHAAQHAAGGADALSPADIGAEKQRLQFSNTSVAASAFVADATYAEQGFNFRAAVPLAGVSALMIPDIMPNCADVMSGNLAPVADSYNGGIYIYAAEVPETAITIPTILCWKEVG